jgi:glycosyltransferase involved in cell wall biosynthesis
MPLAASDVMKIVHLLLTHSFAGTERHAIELANAQAREPQHEVTMILHRRAAEDRPAALAHRLDPRVQQVLVGGWGPWAVWAARRAVRRLQPEVAHAHLSHACRALHGLQGLCLRVATLHIHYKAQQHRDLDALIAIAPWQLPAVPEAQRAHTVQIDNWTDARPMDTAARERLRAELGLKPEDFLIGALGRAEHSKGLDLLIQAYLAAKPAGARLAIVGGGRDWARLRKLAPPEVIMPGFVERPQDWFAAFDAFVSAARSEPFGLVFLEAMSAGLPVLASASQGGEHFAALIERPLLPCNDVAAMCQALQQLATKRPLRRAYDLSAFALASKVAEVEAFYRHELEAMNP